MNRTVMMGRIVNDLELSATPNGTTCLKFRIAVDRNFQKKGEERKTDFFNATAWRGTAEFISNYFGKGRMILVEGEFQTNSYVDKNGNNATWYELVVENAYFTGEKANADSAPANTAIPASAPPAPAAAPHNEASAADKYDDDYPF
ncbi:MAG: single-stranded DNA-binding protein [Oscillospiraceae bacterium]|nr:single-stranded DNA-binding protein [Oscillospiraceae bacterium]